MIKTFFVCCLITVILGAPSALFSRSLWVPFFDKTPPEIQVINPAAKVGVGGNGGTLELVVKDLEPGLDEVVVRMRQLRADKELFRKKLRGKAEANLLVEIPAQKGIVGEGAGELEIVAFDRSFYNNRSLIVAKAFVDTKPPSIEALSPQHNLRQGGTQLVIYTARDENLAFSGVRVGDTLFPGFPAGQLDSALGRSDLFAALYTVPVGSSLKADDLKLRAVDVGGNVSEQAFYNKIARRSPRVLAPNNARLLNWLASIGPLFDPGSKGEEDQLLDSAKSEQGKKGAAVDAATLVQSFERVPGTAVLTFADRFNLSKGVISEAGKFFVFTGLTDVKALHGGEVTEVTGSNGVYLIKVDHGLGLSSVYSGVSKPLVREGQQMEVGGVMGSVDSYLGVGTLVSGNPVDPTEWWTQSWITAHVYEKLQDVKKSLGIEIE